MTQINPQQSIYYLLDKFLNIEKEEGREIEAHEAQKYLEALKTEGRINATVDTKKVACQVLKVKSAITFLSKRIGKEGVLNKKRLVEETKKTTLYEHSTLVQAVNYLQEIRGLQAYANVFTFPIPKQPSSENKKIKKEH